MFRGKQLILVVEDSRMIAAMLKRVLESHGFEVLVAPDGLSGLTEARRGPPKLVLADFHMPEMDGLEMVKALRTDPRTRDIPILMLSANDKPEDRAQALAAGADDYAVKGDAHQLVCQIKSLLSRSSQFALRLAERRCVRVLGKHVVDRKLEASREYLRSEETKALDVEMDGLEEIVKEFLAESKENLDQFDRDLAVLENDPTSRETLASAFRTMHTIKGSTGFLGFSALGRLAHAGETLLSQLRDGTLVVDRDITNALLALKDTIRRILSNIEANGQEGEDDYSSLIDSLVRLQAGNNISMEPPSLLHIP